MANNNNRYDAIFDSEIGNEFKEAKEEYKAARKNAKTQAQKMMLMKAYADDLIDLAVDARISGEFELNSELNTLVQSLSRRTYRGKRNW
jgi:hypothetical protein